MRKSRKFAIVAGSTVGALAIGGVAFAYWSTSGSGTGSAATSAGASNLSIVQTSTITGLAPGVAAKSITGIVTNNAANSAYVDTVTVSIDSVTPAGSGACTADDYTINSPVMDVQQDLAAGAHTGFSGASIEFVDSASNQDGCKGATVNLAYASN